MIMVSSRFYIRLWLQLYEILEAIFLSRARFI
jgi:hypothetical protein